ncbi:DUF4031 domain-containing protein [Pseudoxanthomonas winnipegensis]|uniref:DUF4031 domain-containing protein n=1 Tax=Pseudoxanthomonas winnipegensis TaxID=2480810 RepID=A0A4V6MKQ0_9GAMM|nr:DUF4031 domain-containing protein [Pseudoxanthomonas winnipegensis]TAA26542.1 DUF4031 domain-containing protein [Pseudoxanthomonas winnipegensis]
MPVYVDSMRARYGRMVMCHMVADTDVELHRMAFMIGVSRRWFQNPGEPGRHYDICLSKRSMAVNLGAIEITWRQTGLMVIRRRVTGEMGAPAEAQAWFDQHAADKRQVVAP